MNVEQMLTLQQCIRGSLLGEMDFPQILGCLAELGVERYHAEYSRQEATYYWADGDSVVLPLPHEPHPTGKSFSAEAVEAAVRQSQRGEHTYLDFVRKTMAAGCVGYFVQITGRRVLYFGRDGEVHTEHFPPSPTT